MMQKSKTIKRSTTVENYSGAQPRDSQGRFSSGGGGGAMAPDTGGGSGGPSDFGAVQRLAGSLESMMKIKSETIGEKGSSRYQTNHVVSIGNKEIAKIAEVVEPIHVTQGGGSSKAVTIKTMKGKTIGGAYGNLPDAKHGLAMHLAKKSIEKRQK